MQRIERDVPPDMGDRLKGDAAHRRVAEPEADDVAQLVVVHVALDRRHQHHVELRRGEALERARLDRAQVLPPQGQMGRLLQSVELEIDGGAQRGQRVQKGVVLGDAHAVGVDHDVGNAARLRRGDEVEDARVNRRLAAAELDDFRVPLQRH